jgi:AAA+ ATPase superfamily predicted ATPase
MENIIGRTEEKALIKKIENSGEPELLAVYGRRRIGKTFQVHTTLRSVWN